MSKNGDGQDGYGYQWWIPPGVQRTYMASGLMGQYIYVSEPDEVVIARTSTAASSEDDEREILTVFQTIANDLHESAPTSAK